MRVQQKIGQAIKRVFFRQISQRNRRTIVTDRIFTAWSMAGDTTDRMKQCITSFDRSSIAGAIDYLARPCKKLAI